MISEYDYKKKKETKNALYERGKLKAGPKTVAKKINVPLRDVPAGYKNEKVKEVVKDAF